MDDILMFSMSTVSSIFVLLSIFCYKIHFFYQRRNLIFTEREVEFFSVEVIVNREGLRVNPEKTKEKLLDQKKNN